MRAEIMQLLQDAFDILEAEDVRSLFGAENAWEVIEEVYVRYFNQRHTHISPRNRMASAGRFVLQWLAQEHVLNQNRPEFEALLLTIADHVEEWLTSAETLGLVKQQMTRPVSLNGHKLPARSGEAEPEFG
jgi:hypothetical protein